MSEEEQLDTNNHEKWRDMFGLLINEKKQTDELIELFKKRSQNRASNVGRLTRLFKEMIPPLVEWQISEETIQFYFLPPLITCNEKYPLSERESNFESFQDAMAEKFLHLSFSLKVIASEEFQAMFIYFDRDLLKDYAAEITKNAKVELWRDEAWEEIKKFLIELGYKEPILAKLVN